MSDKFRVHKKVEIQVKKIERLIYMRDVDGISNKSQISHSLVVILELNGVLEVQYKEIMIIGDE